MRQLRTIVLILGLIAVGLTSVVIAQSHDMQGGVGQVQKSIPVDLVLNIPIDGVDRQVTIPLVLDLKMNARVAGKIQVEGEEVIATAQQPAVFPTSVPGYSSPYIPLPANAYRVRRSEAKSVDTEYYYVPGNWGVDELSNWYANALAETGWELDDYDTFGQDHERASFSIWHQDTDNDRDMESIRVTIFRKIPSASLPPLVEGHIPVQITVSDDIPSELDLPDTSDIPSPLSRSSTDRPAEVSDSHIEEFEGIQERLAFGQIGKAEAEENLTELAAEVSQDGFSWLVRNVPIYNTQSGEWMSFDRYIKDFTAETDAETESRLSQDPVGTAIDLVFENPNSEEILDWFGFGD